MVKRLASMLLWFYAGWTAGATVEYFAGLNGVTIGPVLGILLGTAAAALFAGDPRRKIWARRTASTITAGVTVPVQNPV